MKIYKVNTDIRISQIIQRDDHDELFDFNCSPMLNNWKSDGWYIYNPIDPKSNFYCTPGGVLIFDEKVYESDLYTLLEMSGEILPVEIEGEKFYFLNVMECINALNKEATKYETYLDGTKSSIIEKHVFHPQRIGGNPLFKIPETRRNDVLCFEGISDPWDEFKGRYDELGFTGLEFIELYDSDKENKRNNRDLQV